MESLTDEIKRQTDKDMAFEDKLKEFGKEALVTGLAQLSAKSEKRAWLLEYLRGVEKLAADVNGTPFSQQESIFEAIRIERRMQDEDWGPVHLNPHTLDEWTTRLQWVTKRAADKARYGDEVGALEKVLEAARDAVACLEDRIGHLAGARGNGPLSVIIDNGQAFDEKNEE